MKRRRRSKQGKSCLTRILTLILALVLVGGVFYLAYYIYQDDFLGISSERRRADTSESLVTAELGEASFKEVDYYYEAETEAQPIRHDFILDESEIYSDKIVLLDLETGEILYGKNERNKAFPASLTKIMTTLVALEDIEDLNVNVTMTQEIYDRMIIEDASVGGFLPGEVLTARDAVYGTMLPSGGDASLLLAQASSETVEKHIEKMNDRAKKMGLKDTHFACVTGLHRNDNFSTALDMANMTRLAMDDEDFKEVFTKDSFTTITTAEHPEGITWQYSVLNFMESFDNPGFEILGGKTGYTEEAGLCLASIARVEGREYILVTLGAPFLSETTHFEDAYNIYNQLTIYLKNQ